MGCIDRERSQELPPAAIRNVACGKNETTPSLVNPKSATFFLYLPRTAQEHCRNQRTQCCHGEYCTDRVETMPALPQRGPVCRNRVRARCADPGVDWIDEQIGRASRRERAWSAALSTS